MADYTQEQLDAMTPEEREAAESAEPLNVAGQAIDPVDINAPDLTEQTTKLQTNLAGVGSRGQSALQGIESGEVSYGGVDANVLKEEAAVDAGSKYITPEATVSGQLETLLNKESEYMKNAEKRANERSASLGLLGSSMASGAAQRAAIETAMPIAQQDAQTYSKAALAEQATYNEISRMKAESDLSAVAREHIYDIDTNKSRFAASVDLVTKMAQAEGNAALETYLVEAKGRWDAEIKSSLTEFNARIDDAMAAREISAREKEWATTLSSQIMGGVYGTIADLMSNSDFMAAYADAEPGELDKVFNNFIGFGKDHLAFIGSSASLMEEYTGLTEGPDTGWIDWMGLFGNYGDRA